MNFQKKPAQNSHVAFEHTKIGTKSSSIVATSQVQHFCVFFMLGIQNTIHKCIFTRRKLKIRKVANHSFILAILVVVG